MTATAAPAGHPFSVVFSRNNDLLAVRAGIFGFGLAGASFEAGAWCVDVHAATAADAIATARLALVAGDL